MGTLVSSKKKFPYTKAAAKPGKISVLREVRQYRRDQEMGQFGTEFLQASFFNLGPQTAGTLQNPTTIEMPDLSLNRLISA